MKFLSNTYDPKRKDAKMHVVRSFHGTDEQAWKHHQEWLQGKVIGRPKATDAYSVEQLEEMGMVGVYAP